MTLEDQFNTFWRTYPRRISKGTARTAFAKAIRKTTLETILAAIEDYKRFKPERIDYKHPATWLNGECWDDEWQTVPQEVTNRRRNFVDAAMDRINGSEGVFVDRRALERISPEQQRPGPDIADIRSSVEGYPGSSRH